MILSYIYISVNILLFADLPDKIVCGFVLMWGEVKHQVTSGLQRNNHTGRRGDIYWTCRKIEEILQMRTFYNFDSLVFILFFPNSVLMVGGFNSISIKTCEGNIPSQNWQNWFSGYFHNMLQDAGNKWDLVDGVYLRHSWALMQIYREANLLHVKPIKVVVVRGEI